MTDHKLQHYSAMIICGPTASGKTDLGHIIAQHHKGEIINADSMQIYKQIPIITASPGLDLQSQLPYHLYNFLDIDEEFSAVQYCHKASEMVRDIAERGKLPIIVGGSGMYINMLINGYSAIPDISAEVRTNAREYYDKIGRDRFFQILQKIDPEVAAILSPGDKQRVVRAYEVFIQTGKSILFWQRQGNVKPMQEFRFDILCLIPERGFLYNSCNSRLKQIFADGAIEEADHVYKYYPDNKTSAMKALGVSEIISYLKGEITYDKALELASAKTRQYAKRQCTWFTHQINDKKIITFATLQEYKAILHDFSCSALL